MEPVFVELLVSPDDIADVARIREMARPRRVSETMIRKGSALSAASVDARPRCSRFQLRVAVGTTSRLENPPFGPHRSPASGSWWSAPVLVATSRP